MTVTADTNNRPILPFILVVISALVLRLVWIDVSEFQHDEAYLSLLALDALDMRQFPLLGMPSSVGIPNAPASLWLTIIPYALGGDALVATAFVALLNAGGVVLLYLLARRWFGWQGAFAAGMIYAVSPWAVIYSRKIWAQNMHTPFILLALLLGDIGFREGRRWAQVLALPVLVFGLQMHYAAWTLLPIVMWWLWTGRKRLSRGALIASIILAVLVMLPFGVGLVQSESVTVTGLMDRFVSSDETDSTLQINTASLQVHQYFLTMDRLDIYFAPGQLTELYGRLNVMRWVWIGFFGGSALLGLMALRKRPDMLALFGLWLIVPIIVFTLDWTSVFPHYFIPSLPALYLLVGMGVGLLWERLPRLRWVTAPVFGTVILSLVVLWYSVLIYGDSVHVERGFGRTFADLSPVSQAVAARENVLLVTDRYRDFNHPQPTTWATLLHDKVDCLRVVDGGAFTVIPPTDNLQIIYPPEQPIRQEYSDLMGMVFPMWDGSGSYSVHEINPIIRFQNENVPIVDPVQFENGVRLQGIAVEMETERVVLDWLMPMSQPGENLQYFVHLYDANGERVAQRDTDFVPGRFWCEGDRLLTRVDLAVPDDTAIARIGLYSLDEARGFVNTAVLDAGEQPTALWADIPLHE